MVETSKHLCLHDTLEHANHHLQLVLLRFLLLPELIHELVPTHEALGQHTTLQTTQHAIHHLDRLAHLLALQHTINVLLLRLAHLIDTRPPSAETRSHLHVAHAIEHARHDRQQVEHVLDVPTPCLEAGPQYTLHEAADDLDRDL